MLMFQVELCHYKAEYSNIFFHRKKTQQTIALSTISMQKYLSLDFKIEVDGPCQTSTGNEFQIQKIP